MGEDRCPEYSVFKQHMVDGDAFRDKIVTAEVQIINLKESIMENRANIGALAKEIKANFYKTMIGNGILLAITTAVMKVLIN